MMKKRILSIIVRLFIYFLIINISVSIIYFYLYSKPSRFKSEFNPTDFNLKWHDVSVKNRNIELKGWLIPNDKTKKALILMHGWPAEKSDILPYTHFLSERFNLLYIDIRGLGESQGYVCGAKDEIEDIRKWINFLKAKGITEIGLFGYSYGGFLAVKASSEIEQINFVIADSPFNSIKSIMEQITKVYSIFQIPLLFFLDIEYRIICKDFMNSFEISSYIKKIKVPTLIICGSNDEICYNNMIKNYNTINPKVEVFLMPGLKHGETLINKNFRNRLNSFFRSIK